MTRDATQGFGADVAFADVPVAIDARIVHGARVVKMNRVHVPRLHCLLYTLEQRFESVFLADVVTGGERMGRVETNAERQLRASAHERFEVFEAMTDAIALSRRVFQKNFQLAEPQTLARNLQARRAQRDAVRLAGATSTTGMDHKIIDAEQQRPLDFLAKRSP